MARTVPYGEGRDLLIRATVSVVAERGLRGLTFRSAAERAGVSNTLVARHFGTREALLEAALDWATERTIQSTSLLDLASEEQFAAALMHSLTVEPELQAFQYEMIWEARRSTQYRERIARLYDRYIEAVAESLTRFGLTRDVPQAARTLFATLDGLVLEHLAGVDRDTMRDSLRRVWISLNRLKHADAAAQE
ncbi:MAG TPA: TetR family transcriptional regulator [Microbacterium sp.]|nr:TetR family transcriptional regulator [Microbacterium sp.]